MIEEAHLRCVGDGGVLLFLVANAREAARNFTQEALILADALGVAAAVADAILQEGVGAALL